MKIHLTWMRVTASAAVLAGVGVQPAAAQYAPYRPLTQQRTAAPAPAPQQAQAPPVQTPYMPYTASRPQAQYQAPGTTYQPTPTPQAYNAPAAAQYGQPTPAYPQYSQYPQTAAQYPTTYGPNPYAAQQPTQQMLAAKPNDSAAKGKGSAAMNGAATNGNMPAPEGANGAQAGCGCNGSATYGGGDYYNGGACGCNSGNYGISNYFGGDSCNENQWFGGIYFLEMSRTNATPVKLTVEVDHSVAPDPYYPQPAATIMTTRDVNFDFREGLEVRVGSTFTVGEPCSACESGCNGYGYGYGGCNGGSGCGSCAPTTYAWEAAWWGINNDANIVTSVYQAPLRIYGMKNFIGLQYDRDGAGAAYAYRSANEYYGYNLPIPDPGAGPPVDGYIRVLAQRERTDFKAQNLELNIIRFPVCDTGCGCNSGCNGGCGTGDACGGGGGALAGLGACGCDDDCGGSGFSMYGSCGVRYFHMHDYFMYGTEFGEYSAAGAAYDQAAYNGFTYDNSNELVYNLDVKNNLVGPQLGWTNDYCWGKWNLFLNSTFGIFDNHMTATQRMYSGGGGVVRFAGDGSTANVRSSKDAVAFMGELRAGAAYDVTCHWRAVAAYRAVGLTGVATATDQMATEFTNKESVAIINSDNSVIIHGVQVGAECRY